MIIALGILSVGIKSCKIRLDGHKNSVFCIEREKQHMGKSFSEETQEVEKQP